MMPTVAGESRTSRSPVSVVMKFQAQLPQHIRLTTLLTVCRTTASTTSLQPLKQSAIRQARQIQIEESSEFFPLQLADGSRQHKKQDGPRGERNRRRHNRRQKRPTSDSSPRAVQSLMLRRRPALTLQISGVPSLHYALAGWCSDSIPFSPEGHL